MEFMAISIRFFSYGILLINTKISFDLLEIKEGKKFFTVFCSRVLNPFPA